jgi:hypothetical protein
LLLFSMNLSVEALDVQCSKSHIHFLVLSSWQRIRPFPRLFCIFNNKFNFYDGGVLSPHPSAKLKGCLPPAVCNCCLHYFWLWSADHRWSTAVCQVVHRRFWKRKHCKNCNTSW